MSCMYVCMYWFMIVVLCMLWVYVRICLCVCVFVNVCFCVGMKGNSKDFFCQQNLPSALFTLGVKQRRSRPELDAWPLTLSFSLKVTAMLIHSWVFTGFKSTVLTFFNRKKIIMKATVYAGCNK